MFESILKIINRIKFEGRKEIMCAQSLICVRKTNRFLAIHLKLLAISFLAGAKTSSTRFNLIKCEGRDESMCAHSLICMRKTNTLSRELMVVLTVNQRGPQNQFTFHLIQLRS